MCRIIHELTACSVMILLDLTIVDRFIGENNYSDLYIEKNIYHPLSGILYEVIRIINMRTIGLLFLWTCHVLEEGLFLFNIVNLITNYSQIFKKILNNIQRYRKLAR